MKESLIHKESIDRESIELESIEGGLIDGYSIGSARESIEEYLIDIESIG